MKRDIKLETSVSQYYRKLANDITKTPTGKLLSKTEQEHLKALYYLCADEVEREEQEALKMYKIRNYKRGVKK